VLAARRRFGGSEQDKSVVALLAQLLATGPTRATDLAELAGLDLSTVSRHLSTLEADGYVDRAADPADGRATLLHVSPAGQRYLAEVRRQRREVLAEAVAGWSEKNLTTLTRLTRRLAKDMESL